MCRDYSPSATSAGFGALYNRGGLRGGSRAGFGALSDRAPHIASAGSGALSNRGDPQYIGGDRLSNICVASAGADISAGAGVVVLCWRHQCRCWRRRAGAGVVGAGAQPGAFTT